VAFINSYNLSINLRKYQNIEHYRQALKTWFTACKIHRHEY
jgi:hypothetical protein